MKLAAIYNVWDSEYLLRGSINQIRQHVDLVIVVFQESSNYGAKNPDVRKVCLDMRKEELINVLIEYNPYKFPNRNGFRNESIKRNLGLDIAKREGCSHYILMDCDEYYDPGQFVLIKTYIDQNPRHYDFTRISMYTYFKEPEWKLFPIENYYVPFICRLTSKLSVGTDYSDLRVDPTRAPKENVGVIQFPIESIVMHHYSWVRKDIRMKLQNSSAVDNFAQYGGVDKIVQEFLEYNGTEEEKVPFYDGHVIKKVENLFNINIKEDEKIQA